MISKNNIKSKRNNEENYFINGYAYLGGSNSHSTGKQ